MSPLSNPSRRARAGFTMVEMLAVIGIIVLLFALLMGIVNAVTKKGETTRVRHLMAEVEGLLREFHDARGFYPAALNGAGDTLANFVKSDPKRAARKYESFQDAQANSFTYVGGPRRATADKYFQDVWGADFYYRLKVNSNQAYVLGSFGPDSFPGRQNFDDDNNSTKDDISEFGFGDDLSNENTN